MAIAALVVACSPSTTAPESLAAPSIAVPSITSASASTGSIAPTGSPSSSVGPSFVASGPGVFILPDPGVGLDALSSYRATLTTSFDGVDADGPSLWTRTRVMTYAAESGETSLATEVSGDLPPADPSFEAETGGVAYAVRAGTGCVGKTIDPADNLRARAEPALILSGLVGAETAGLEAVAGGEASVYTFDERALGLSGGVTSATGEVWVATEGGYVARYTMRLEAGADFLGESTIGTMSVEYELTSVGAPITIDLPTDCPPGLIDAPVMPNAVDVVDLPGMLAFTTAASLEDVVAFYEAAGRERGWDLPFAPTIATDTALLEYVDNGRRTTLIATRRSETTTVQIGIDTSSE